MILHSFRKQRRALSRGLAQRSCRRLDLEWLEDRVVPASLIPDGTLLVATFPSSSASTTFAGILGFNPNTGSQVYSTPANAGFTEPTYMTEGPDGTLYVTDQAQSLVYAVNPDTNTASVVPITGLRGPNLIAYVDGNLIIVNVGTGQIGQPISIVQYNLNTHTASGPFAENFLVPSGLVPVPGQDAVYLSDEQGNYNTDQTVFGYGAIYELTINPNGNVAPGISLISEGTPSNPGDFDHAVDIAVDASGNILVANTGNTRDNVTGSLFLINRATETQTWIVQGPHQDGSSGGGAGFGAFSGTDSVEVGSNGNPYVGEIQGSSTSPAQILEVFGEGPGAGFTSRVMGSDANNPTAPPLSETEGMRTYHVVPTGPAATATSVFSSTNPSVFGQDVTFTAVVSSSSGTPSGTVLFLDDGSVFGSGTLNASGVTTFTTPGLPVGSQTITASYTGNSSFASSSNSIIQTVDQASTATKVTSSGSPAQQGSTVTFTATITVLSPGSTAAASPTGTVNFFDNGNFLATEGVTTTNGITTATFATSTLPLGTNPITASYSGDGNFIGSPSPVFNQSITPAPAVTTTTAVTSSANPSVFGQSVTFTATVTASNGSMPTGTVNFFVDGSMVSSPMLSGGVATYTTTTLAVGTHSVSATYVGNSSFATSNGSLAGGQTVNKAATTTTVTSTGSPAQQGSTVIFTATITVNSPGSTAVAFPTGTVTFFDNGSSLGAAQSVSTSNGVTTASFSISSLGVGNHPITASYSGDGNFQASVSAVFNQSITPAPAVTTTTAVTSSANPSVFGQSVTFTATVTASNGSTPTGTVNFFVDGSLVSSPTLSGGVATYTTTTLAVGTHSVSATYVGNSSFATSNGSLAGGQTVNKAATTTTVTSTGSPAQQGSTVIFTATITVNSPGSTAVAFPTGTVTFFDNGSSLGAAQSVSTSNGVTTASFSISSLGVGNHPITASYSGDGNFQASVSAVFNQSITPVPAVTTTTAVTSSANPSVFGQSVTFTATVTASNGSTPTGTVNFFVDGSLVSSPTLSGGVATYTTNTLAVGNHTVSATYLGTSSFATSNGSLAGGQAVNQAATTTTVTSTGSPAQQGSTVIFTATITVNSPGSTAVTFPTGTVTFFDNGSSLGAAQSVSTSNGVTTASFSISSLGVGNHPITASYSGDGNFQASVSAVFNQSITPVPAVTTTTAVTSSANPSVFGQSVTFTATVTASNGSTPTGTVNFFVDGSLVSSPMLSGGVATYTTTTLAVGTHSVSATYVGNSSFATSNGSLAGGQTVNQAQTNTVVTSSLNPSLSGQSVAFTATITVQSPGSTAAANPTGTVTFFDDGNSLGTEPVSTDGNGVTTATFSTSSLSVATHDITATYSGDTNFATSTSAVLTQVVNQTTLTATTTTVTSSANPSLFGQSITFTATVTPNSGGGTPTGSVVFFIDGSPFTDHLPLSGGVAVSPAISTLSVGTHTITAVYSGDSNFAGSTSAPFTQTVNPSTPTLTDGTILVVSSPSSSQSSAPTGIIGVDPSTGQQFLVSTGGMFSLPDAITEGNHDLLYVADLTADKTGAIIVFDPSTGQQSLVATGTYINDPDAVVYMNGHLFVADLGSGTTPVPNIVDINLGNDKQTLVLSAGGLQKPVGLAAGPGNSLYVLDAAGTGTIYKVDVATGNKTVVTLSGLFNHPVGLAEDSSGNLYVINQGASPNTLGSIVEVNPHTGAQKLVSQYGILGPGLTSGTVNQDGTIYVGAMTVGKSLGQVISVDPQSGAQNQVSQGNNLDLVEGLTVFYDNIGGGAAAAPDASSPSSLVLGPIQANSTSVVPATTVSRLSASQNQDLPIQSFAQLSSLPAAGTADDGSTQAALPTTAIDSFFADWGKDLSQAMLWSGAGF